MGLSLNELQAAVRSKMDSATSDTNVSESCCTPMQPETSTSFSNPLEEAIRITKGDRQNSYGHPTDDFFRTAGLWTSLLGLPPGTITPEKVALMMVLLKISREMNRHKMDNLVDMAGYVNCLDMIYKRKQLLEPAAGMTLQKAARYIQTEAEKRVASVVATQRQFLNPVHDAQEAL